MEITKDELDELVKRAVPLWIKIVTPDETIFLEAKRMTLVPLKHKVKTNTGLHYDTKAGGDIILIGDPAVRSNLKTWPHCVQRAAKLPFEDVP